MNHAHPDAFRILHGDALALLRTLPEASVNCVVTSPPYWGLRDYGTGTWEGGDPACVHSCGGQVQDSKAPGAITAGVRPGVNASECRKCGAIRVDQQIGLERTPDEYVARMVQVFREVRRVLRPDGTCWVNLGDSYATGAGKVGDCPGGGTQGARWRGDHPVDPKRNSASIALGPHTQPNRMPLPGLKPKDLVGIPWRVAFALQSDGWWLRQDIIWHKPNPMPESVRDRFTKAHEYVFLLSKSQRYYWNREAVQEPTTGHAARKLSWTERKATGEVNRHGTDGAAWHGSGSYAVPDGGRNMRSVWTIPTQPFPEAHFATFPEALVEPCILAGCPPDGTVLDPFAGSGTVGVVALRHGRKFLGLELKQEYVEMAHRRITEDAPLFNREAVL